MADTDTDTAALRAAIAALEGQRATLGDAVLELAVAPLRARLAALQRPVGLQRRQVTVLFADVVGSTAMAQGIDAEDTLAILSGALRRMADIVEAHKGRVLRFTGDGVKAAFGMDETREDDAERAVRAGLAIRQAGREQAEAALRLHGVADFAVRVGLHTGDVALGAGVDADNTAMGVAVNIAARMEQSAPPGALRISHDTWSQVRGLFDVEAQPPLVVKGIEAPMQTYLVRAALERSVASVERGLQGLRTPMVGRDAELQRLRDTVARAQETRQLQALTLLGDAGLGKSRLLRELTAALARVGSDCRVLALRSQPDGQLRPWGLLRSLLATQFGVADTDSAEVARRKVVDGLAPWFAERGEQQAQLIGQLSGLDFGDSPHVRGLDPRGLRDQALAAVRAYLQALAAQGGTLPVLLVEDLHWADDSSLDLLQHLQAHATELPLALLMTGRPALRVRRADWSTPETTVVLSPLAEAQRGELALALLQRMDPLPPELTALIVGRAEGNPYYMEELVRRLVDDGVIDATGPRWTLQTDRLDTLRLPGTLVGLLQARLDALPPGERQAARQASVIGHVFWDDALQALDSSAPQALPALQRAAFVHAKATSDFEGTAERQFDHHLLHQVTYDTLLKAERRLGHGAAARWLSERTQGRGAEFLAMTGEHAERAGELALAITCFEQAGVEARKRFANVAAQTWLRRAVGLLGESDPPRRFGLLQRMESLADVVGDRADQELLHAEMAALLDRHPDDKSRARLLFNQMLLADRRGDFPGAGRLARECFELAERCGAAQQAALSQSELAYLKHQLDGDHLGALEHVEIGLQWAARIEEGADHLRLTTEAQLMSRSAQISIALGRWVSARETLLVVQSRGEELASHQLQITALLFLASLAERVGRWDEAAACAERIRALAQAAGQRQMVGKAYGILGRAAAGQGDNAASLHWREQALEISRAVGDRYFEAFLLKCMGMSTFDLGDASAALDWFVRSKAAFEAIGLAYKVLESRADIALCQARLGDVGPALPEVEQVLAHLQAHPKDDPGAYLDVRWTCQQVLAAAGDARAGPMLEALFADVQTCAAELAAAAEFTEAAQREGLIHAVPTFREIASEHARRSAPTATA
jgi:class 3 adenylate cyclase/tetratricopeptide (TPR) repeat protein